MKATFTVVAGIVLTASACQRGTPVGESTPSVSAMDTRALEKTTITATLDVAGIAEPLLQATLSTKLMGTVVAIEVKEGDLVKKGQVLARVDAADLTAQGSQVAASLADARAMYAEADRQLARMSKLNADKAAPRAMLDAAQTAHARAEAAVAAAEAKQAELDATRRYAEIRAPFPGQVVKRFVDPGAFAAPGAPLVTVQDASSLRASAAVPPSIANGITRGTKLGVSIEGVRVDGIVEGVVPVAHGALYTLNVVIDNASGHLLAGSAATIHVPTGQRTAILVPTRHLIREGDLVGVRVRGQYGVELRWVRVGDEVGQNTEVLSGLRPGDEIVVARAEGH